MFSVVLDKFHDENADLKEYRKEILDHMRYLWKNWRGDFYWFEIWKRSRTKKQPLPPPNFTVEQALKKALTDPPPEGLDKEDWVRSARNSKNRAALSKELLHCTGSRGYRQLFKDMTQQNGKGPNLGEMFLATPSKSDKLATPELSQQYEKNC